MNIGTTETWIDWWMSDRWMEQWVMDGWYGTFLCWMVKLTGSVRLVLFTDARITVKTSEFISVLFSVWKYWWLSRLSIPFSVMKTTEAEPEPKGLMSDIWERGQILLRRCFLCLTLPHRCWHWLVPASSCPTSGPWPRGQQRCPLVQSPPHSLGWWCAGSNLKGKLKKKNLTWNGYFSQQLPPLS